MLRVGDKEVIYTSTFIVPHGEEAHLSFESDDVDARFRIQFVEDSENKNVVKFDTSPDPNAEDGNGGLITLTNWNQKGRVATPEPISVISLENSDVWMLASAVYAERKFLITLQFMKGEKE